MAASAIACLTAVVSLHLPIINSVDSSATIRVDSFDLDDVAEVYALECNATAFPWRESLFRDSVDAGHRCLCIRSANNSSEKYGSEKSSTEKNGGEKNSGEKIIAFAIFSLVVDEASLLDIAVHPDFQGKGLGRSLLTVGLTEMLSKGAQTCMLEVRASNQAAQALYYSLGFYEVGQRPGYYPGKSASGKQGPSNDSRKSAKKGQRKSGREDALVLCMPLSVEALEYDV